MPTPSRPLLVLGVFAIGLLFYLTGPFAAKTIRESEFKSNADARLARWIEAITFADRPSTGSDGSTKSSNLDKAKPLIPINPFPLGKPTASMARRSPQATSIDFTKVTFRYQNSLRDPLPWIPLEKNLDAYSEHKPHNYRAGTAGPTYATFLSTRNGSMYDPYFVATQNLVYQLLWSSTVASKYPITVFVAPHIPQKQRSMLAGAGAIVRELDLLPWEPKVEGVHVRLRDQFSKLNMWAQTEFSMIAFLDADTFLLKNIDEIFELASPQKCDDDQLSGDDADAEKEICDYVFAGVENVGSHGSINGGLLVFKPNEKMHQRLVRNYRRTDKYRNIEVEQDFLRWQFDQAGPFPAQLLPRKYNGYFPQHIDEGHLYVVHSKLWALDWDEPWWTQQLWDPAYKEMAEFYDSRAFERDRGADGLAHGATEYRKPVQNQVPPQKQAPLVQKPGLAPKQAPPKQAPAQKQAPPAGKDTPADLKGRAPVVARENDHMRLQQGKDLHDDAVQEKQRQMLEKSKANRMVREDKS